ncbi:universal stress protein [Halogeometricum luteum]|uniref:Universal stress protein n=1 Tax=Halogeometricum luteum TaxID=2950537 RepID=A0ABU2G387_9EURY|nr:universal stress protein [Halogeometricum sp. S3BR5-2]MDS0295255.1 universal stress protein [Halogeometricum sp. S3BR5-2]
MYETILLPVDGSDPSNRAVEHALEIAERFAATVHAVHVVDTRRYGEPTLSSTELVLDELEDRGHDLLEELADRADNSGIAVEKQVCHGDPATEIISHADAVDADIIVLGSRGTSHQRTTHLGSVADRVVRRAGRPVLTT